MASSASTTLRMELMATGENDATWGTKTNTNLQIVEAALAGITTVSTTGGSTTLTNVDYTNDQAKKALIKVTGSLSSNATIVVPNATKQYFVWNATSGSYTVSVKTSSGSAVAVTQSTVANLYCDGSNTITFLTCMSDPTTGAPATSSGAAASSVSVTPGGNLSSNNAQSALVELQGDIDTINSTSLPGKQPLDADLTAIAGLTRAKGSFIVGGASAWAAQSVGTNGYVMMADSAQANGVKWASMIPSGTIMLFYKSTAPTGWTATSSNDYAVRIVSSGSGGTTGGSTAFTSVFTSRTIAQTNLPNVTLSVTGTTSTDGAHTHTYNRPDPLAGSAHPTGSGRSDPNDYASDNTGSSGSHSHTVTGTTSALGSGTAMDFAVRYYNCILCSKD